MTDTISAPAAASTWYEKAAELNIDGRPVINGERVDALSGQTHPKTNPANGETNGTPFGLAASMWTGSMARAHRVSSRLVAGTVSVNTVDALGFTTPFGGFKQSGFGRDLSVHALENYSDFKTTWLQWG